MLIGRIFPATQAMVSLNGLAFNIETGYSGTLALEIIVLIGFAATGIAFWRFKTIGKDQ
ncbi:MAG: hypothetical protein ABFC94_07105 [Syntrophomonas sp.]